MSENDPNVVCFTCSSTFATEELLWNHILNDMCQPKVITMESETAQSLNAASVAVTNPCEPSTPPQSVASQSVQLVELDSSPNTQSLHSCDSSLSPAKVNQPVTESSDVQDDKSVGASSVDSQSSIKCGLCNIDFSSKDALVKHTQTEIHKQRLHAELSSPNIVKTSQIVYPTAPTFSCSDCQISLSSKKSLDIHLSGRKHKLHLMRNKVMTSPLNLTPPLEPINADSITANSPSPSDAGHATQSTALGSDELVTLLRQLCLTQTLTLLPSYSSTSACKNVNHSGDSLLDEPLIVSSGTSALISATLLKMIRNVCHEELSKLLSSVNPVLRDKISESANTTSSSSTSTEKSDTKRAFFCEICNVNSTSLIAHNTHLSGKKHRRNVSLHPREEDSST